MPQLVPTGVSIQARVLLAGVHVSQPLFPVSPGISKADPM